MKKILVRAILGTAAAMAAPVFAQPTAPAAPELPQIVRDETPRYPTAALAQGVSGGVLLRFTIAEDGRPQQITAAGDPRLVDAAMAAARRWRFKPVPHALTVERVIRFDPGARPAAQWNWIALLRP